MKAALRLISRDNNNGPLKLDSQISETETVREVLMKKHPPQQPAKISSIVTGDTQTTEPHPVLFDKIDLSAEQSSRWMEPRGLQV